MSFLIDYSIVSHIGKVRLQNEDNFLSFNGEYIDDKQWLELTKNKTFCNGLWKNGNFVMLPSTAYFSAVFDGMGGHNAGEIASRYIAMRLSKLHKGKTKSFDQAVDVIRDAILKANIALHDNAAHSDRTVGMGSTLAGVILSDSKLVSVNVGDSSVYLINNSIEKISHDHSEAQRLIDIGAVSPNDTDVLRSKKALNRYMGMSCTKDDDITHISNTFEIDENTSLLLCSDGLTDVVSKEIILESFKCLKTEDIVRKLLEHALLGNVNQLGGIDNITIIVIKFSKKQKRFSFKESRKCQK